MGAHFQKKKSAGLSSVTTISIQVINMNPVGPTDKYLCLQGKTFFGILGADYLELHPEK